MNNIIESSELLEATLNFVDAEPIKTAIKTLFKKGDIVEVRAWGKAHDVYTGRYKYGTRLVDALNIATGEGWDTYVVLNPVGDKHGERVLSGGGLCTWEQDVPWRRRFLLDFDPKRNVKIATHEQWTEAYEAASQAKAWLVTYGFKGVILASSGNGCHLLVPAELPNNTEGKEIVRKVQRIVADKFSTDAVECECFPDANRLVRAYGTRNMKGEETDTLTHRVSEILHGAAGTDDDPKAILLKIIADHPTPELTTRQHGTGDGPFSRDLLFSRFEAWATGWEGENGEEFIFEETDRHDGFRILCPGNTETGWPDGEQHETVGESLNDSCIAYVENGWPRFSCRHNHCGEGSAHGKKTWQDLQNYYDHDRAFHRIMDETDYSAKWNIEYVDDGMEDMGEADVDSLMAEDKIQVAVNDYREPLKKMAEPEPVVVKQEEPEAETQATDEPEVTVKHKLYKMPESCMYGWLGDVARALETPLGFAYPAVLTTWAAQIQAQPRHTRPTLYTALMGAVHCGKSETIKRARAYIHLYDADAIKTTVPGSDRGLINIFGGKKKDKDDKNSVPDTPKTRLLIQDELRNTVAKANISGSSLPATLCSLWSEDEAGAADKSGEHICLVRLNILGALKAEDPEEFAEVFGKESTAGLYDRFIYGIAPDGWKYRKWDCPPPVMRAPKGCIIPGVIFKMLDEWRDVDPKTRGRLGEIALRIAYITSSANHDGEVTEEAMRCALEFAAWQEAIRSQYKAGMGDALEAQATNAILLVLEKLAPGVWIRWGNIALNKNWYKKFGASTLSRVRDSLAKTGITIEETVETENGKPKRTGRLRLRVDGD